MFSEPDRVESFLVKRFGSVGDSELATRISSNVLQAREFFESAGKASLQTKPTLVYYGQLNLASATYGLLSNKLATPMHGMGRKTGNTLRNWSITFQERGAIQSFAELFGVRIDSTPRSSSSSTCPSLLDFLVRDNTAAPLLEEFDEVPALSLTVQDYRPVPDAVINGQSKNLYWFLIREDDRESRIQRLGRTVSYNKYNSGQSVYLEDGVAAPLGIERNVNYLMFVSQALPGQTYWWPYPLRQFAVGWLLSEVSRYKPELLGPYSEPVSRSLGSALELLLSDIERMFPNECLNVIYSKAFCFGWPAIIS